MSDESKPIGEKPNGPPKLRSLRDLRAFVASSWRAILGTIAVIFLFLPVILQMLDEKLKLLLVIAVIAIFQGLTQFVSRLINDSLSHDEKRRNVQICIWGTSLLATAAGVFVSILVLEVLMDDHHRGDLGRFAAILSVCTFAPACLGFGMIGLAAFRAVRDYLNFHAKP